MDASHLQPKPAASSSDSMSSSPDPADGLAPLPTVRRGKKRIPGMSPQMATFSLGKRPRVKRSCAGKVRSGCITCKRRHIKCDETRPFCLKCTKSPRGPGVCEGYEFQQKQPDRQTQPRLIISKGTWRVWPAAVLREPGYESAFFSNPQEKVYFDFWQHLVANIYLFPNDIMVRVVPQLARREPAIKHAALAMAGMARALVPSLIRRSRKELHANGPHYEFALQQYGRAIKLVRSSQPSSENMLWAIVCCVLFVTFECLHGDRNAALSHVNHAYKMMETYFNQRSLVEDGPVTDSIRAVCDDAAWVFQGLTMQAWSHNVLHTKDASQISWCCRGSKRTYAVEEMPTVFTDVHMARRWWRVVQHYTCHRCPIYTEMFVDGLSKEMLVGSYVRPALTPSHLDELAAVLPEFLGHLRRWQNAFQGVYDTLKANQEHDFHAYVDACNLRVQYLTLWTDVSSLSYKDIKMMIMMTPSFREMVQLSRIVLSAQQNCGGCTETFSMDNGPTLPLLIVACRCREDSVRREATELLGKYHRRDGLWDSRAFHNVALKNVAIEAENVNEGDDTEQWSRMSRREVRFSREGDVSGRMFRWQPDVKEWKHVEESLSMVC
ncbi:hypothetical protein CSPX01_01060 [Colletotrichum filicis]|nr:hypothetical protein CSPX01_01060 [Colletotrichum filicis]